MTDFSKPLCEMVECWECKGYGSVDHEIGFSRTCQKCKGTGKYMRSHAVHSDTSRRDEDV